MGDLVRIQQALRDRGSVENKLVLNSGHTRVFGAEFEMNGLGMMTRDVYFPCLFVEKPIWSPPSLELVANEEISNGVPVCNVIVRNWDTVQTEDGRNPLYRGCTLTVQVVAGTSFISADTRFRMTVRFEGRAVSTPIGDS